MPRWSDSLIISPRLWGNWGSGIQEALITHANFDIIYRMFEDESTDHNQQTIDIFIWTHHGICLKK